MRTSNSTLGRKGRAVGTAIALATMILAGCAPAGELPEETLALGELMSEASAGLDTFGMPNTVAEALPAPADGVFETGDPVTAGLVVTGHFTKIEADSAFHLDPETGQVVEDTFGSPQAEWQYVRGTFKIDTVVASAEPVWTSDTVTVLLVAPIGESVGFASSAYRGLGDSAIFLTGDTASPDAVFRPLGSFGDWVFTIDGKRKVTDAPLAVADQRNSAVLADVQALIDAS